MNTRMMLPIELTKILYEKWEGQISTSSQDSQIYGKCLNGFGKVTFKNGNRYEGNFFNGLLNGQGKFIWSNGIVYEGDFTDNRITGKGIYKWPDGSNYEGEVKDGLRHGYGKYTIDDATYEGEWVEGKKQGKGKIVFKSGSIFQGSFKNDMKDGYGKMYYYPSGNYFEGQWKRDVKNGMGTMNWTDIREKYMGQWKDNQQQGWGIHLWLQSKGEGKYMRNRYQGNWKGGVREGFGVFYYANGSRYEGNWKNNMKEGYSFYMDENGKNSLILFSKDRMLKGEKPAQLEAENTKKVPNKKDVEPNYYALCLSIDHFYRPSTPNLQNLYNYLLRNNTQLKAWYKGASNFYDQQSEFSFCLTLEGAWKMIRSLNVLGNFSLAEFNRGLSHLNPDIQSLLNLIPQNGEERVNYEDIYYRYLSQQTDRKDFNIEALKQKTIDTQSPFKEYVVHNREQNILFRQFVHLLVWMAHNLQVNLQKPQKSIQKLMLKITPFLQSISKVTKASGGDNFSENKSSISKAEKNLTPFFRNANAQVFKEFVKHSLPTAIAKKDETLRMRQLLGLGRLTGCIGEPQWILLQRILQKYFDNEILNGEKQANWSNSQLSPKILSVLNYELIEYQFTELVYILFIKKLPSTKQTEENKKKYLDSLQELFAASRVYSQQKQQRQEFKKQIRYIHSKKSQQRKLLQERRRVMEKKKEEAEALVRQIERQQKEMQLMKLQDSDVKEGEFDDEPSDFEI